MIVIFGAPGAGKSLQGQMLAARYGWRWLSAGQLLRDTKDPEILRQMSTGALIDNDFTNSLVSQAINKSKDIEHVILDAFPRQLEQAKWLVDNQPHHGKSISLVMVIEVPHEELSRRLRLRGRPDDAPQAARERLKIYQDRVSSILEYFKQNKVPVVHLSGLGTVGEVHDRIVSELKTWQLV